jgi:hypothetical protein
MKSLKWILGIATVVLIVVLSGRSRKQVVPGYALATETVITGEVTEVQEFYCPLSEDQGMHLMLKTSNGQVQVHLGPGRFLRTHEVRFSPGDRVRVVGSRLRYKGEDALMAREVNRGTETLTFRDAEGKPLWQ